MEFLYCAICLVVGAVVTGLVVAVRYRAELRFLKERKAGLEAECGQWKSDLAGAQAKALALTGELATAKADLINAARRLEDYGKEVERMQGRLKVEFENLANRVLEEKSAKFAKQNQASLDQLLNPLREQIGEFKSRVEAVHTADTADRAVLRTQIESLAKASAEMSGEAKNLTLALKGDSKTQGNWGELILEKVLENSGLTRGVEFTVQAALRSDEGANLRPDVLIHLPEGRHFVVDAKVSLTAYERYCNAADAEEQKKPLREHVVSLRKHVEELAAKRYQDLYAITAPDFVFMFIPVEPAFSCAMQSDRELFNDAFEKKVILVTPSTLLATLRTVAQIWKQEKQTRFALDIARRSGALYDKFVDLYGDLMQIGSSLNATTEAYHAALNKLKDGKGNLVKKVEDIRRLGAKASKVLPEGLVQEAEEG